MAVYELILEREGRELVATIGRRLPAIGPLATYDMHLIIIGATNHIARHLGIGGRCRIEMATDDTTILIAAHTIAMNKRCNDTWELNRHIGTILIAVHISIGTLLPLVGTMQVQIKFLAGMESITTGKTDSGLRTISATGTSDGITLDIEIVGFIKGAVQAQVEGIRIGTGRELEVGTTEHTCGVNPAGRLHIFLVAILLAWAQTEVTQHHARHDGRLLTIEMNGEITALYRIGKHLAGRLAEVNIQLADIPLAQGHIGQAVCQLEPELGLVIYSKGISQVRGIARTVIIVAIVTQQRVDTGALGIEVIDTEGRLALDETLVAG